MFIGTEAASPVPAENAAPPAAMPQLAARRKNRIARQRLHLGADRLGCAAKVATAHFLTSIVDRIRAYLALGLTGISFRRAHREGV